MRCAVKKIAVILVLVRRRLSFAQLTLQKDPAFDQDMKNILDKVSSLDIPAFMAGFVETFKKSSIEDLRSFFKKYEYVKKWYISSDYSFSSATTSTSVNEDLIRQYGRFAYMIQMPKALFRLAPFYLPLFWIACHFSRLAAQARRLMEEYAHKVVVATTFVGVADEVDSMIEMRLSSAVDLRSELMQTLIKNLGANPNLSLDKVKNTTPLSEVAECVARLSGAVKNVQSSVVG